MDKIQRAFTICKMQFYKSLINPAYYIGILVVIGISVYDANYLFDFAASVGDVIGIYEVLTIIWSNYYSFFLFGICLLFCFSGAPFYDSGENNILSRSGRNCWIAGKLLFIIFSVFVIVFLSFLVPFLLHASNIYVANIWSYPLRLLGTQPQIAVNNFNGLSFPFKNVVELKLPLEIMLHTALLSIIYMLLIIVIMFYKNLLSQTTAHGFILGMIVHGSSYMWYMHAPPLLRKFSLLYHAQIGSHSFFDIDQAYWLSDLRLSYILLLLILIAVVAIGFRLARRSDI